MKICQLCGAETKNLAQYTSEDGTIKLICLDCLDRAFYDKGESDVEEE